MKHNPPFKHTVLSTSIGSLLTKAAPRKMDASQTLRFDMAPTDWDLVYKIASRGVTMGESFGVKLDFMTACMDIAAVHCNHRPLRLLSLLLADNDDFSHDFTLIGRAIDRTTGRLHDSAQLRFFEKLN